MSTPTLAELHADLRQSPEYAVHDMMDQVRYQLRRRMAETGTTQAALAEAMNVKAPTVSRLLRAAENTSLLTIARAARALGLTFTTFKLVPDETVALQTDEFGYLLRTEGGHDGWWPRTRRVGTYASWRHGARETTTISNPAAGIASGRPEPSPFALDLATWAPGVDLADTVGAS